MKTLAIEYRRQLEGTVVEARNVAEAGALGALQALAVHRHEPYGHMSAEQRKLRNRLRAHARHLGDRVAARSGAHTIDHLVHECAYEHWHGMLFARLLAENQLLIEPETKVAITLDECEDLAREEGLDKWALAARFAHRMLPQVFRSDHPVLEVRFAREHRLKLESLVEGLPAEVLAGTDALGWVYQFWQTKKKDEVNRSEVKIGADELPAVTQLFTEPYMVQFLLHNSLGAWWVSRHPNTACPVDLTYLRRTEGGVPAAGVFEGWPDDLAQLRLLDPCCGSGHFLVAALLMLAPMRMALEGLNASQAVDAVLRENIHGLESDQRCVAIAAFALALEAWCYPGAGGCRPLPRLNLACCGQPVAGKRAQWLALAAGDSRREAGMAALHDAFREAPTLGSLIDPARSVAKDMLTADFGELQPLLEEALREHAGEEDWEETAIAARGLTEAMRLLRGRYHLVITNVPYLARGKQNERLREFAQEVYPRAKNDLANVFLERCLEFSLDKGAGVTQIVMPQNWLFLTTYSAQRKHLLKEARWELLARLGPSAFETISGEVVKAILLTLTRTHPHDDHELHGIDASMPRKAAEKAEVLQDGKIVAVNQMGQMRSPDARITLEQTSDLALVLKYADGVHGFGSRDSPCFFRQFWEVFDYSSDWQFLQTTTKETQPWMGCEQIVFWQNGKGLLAERGRRGQASPAGSSAWGRVGVAVSQMGILPTSLYTGEIFDKNVAVVCPRDASHLPPLWCYCASPEYHEAVRRIDQNLKVTNATLVKVPFDLRHWRKIAAEKYSNGLPQPYSDDPAQWLFHGHPCGSVVWDETEKRTAWGPLRADQAVLQVAAVRLLGYRWPAERDPDMALADEQRAWVERTKTLLPFADRDGIVCIPSVRGERPAQERLLELLQAAYGEDWRDSTLAKLVAEAGSASLDDWLRNRFFADHCRLFHHRPFIWHIWDGRKRDGFHALVNYHKLAQGDGRGRRLLESLAYSYLGDWTARQQDGVKRGEGGAEERLVAALQLRQRLEAILAGEPPFDLFVRWKPIEAQSIGWDPDIDDGVRVNLRPFMAQDLPHGKKGAGVLRARPNVHWRKDRGKEPMRDRAQFPWFWSNGHFTGERVNDMHLAVAEKRAARGGQTQ